MRAYGSEPVTVTELGDLLYRTARVRSLITPPSAAEDSTAEPQTTSIMFVCSAPYTSATGSGIPAAPTSL